MAAPHPPTVSRTSSTASLVGAGHDPSAPVVGGSQPGATVAAAKTSAQQFIKDTTAKTKSWANKNPRSAEKAAHAVFAPTFSLSLPLIILGAAACASGIGIVPGIALIMAGVSSGAAAVKAEMAHLQMQKHPTLAERNYLGYDPSKPSEQAKSTGGFCYHLIGSAVDAFDNAREAREKHLKNQPKYDKTKPFAHNGFELWTQPGQFNPQSIRRESWLTWDLDASNDSTPLDVLLSRSVAVIKTHFALHKEGDPRYQCFHNPVSQQRLLDHTVGQIKKIVMEKAMFYMPEGFQQKIQDKTKELYEAQANKPKHEQLSAQQLQQKAMDTVIEASYPQLAAESLLAALKKRLGLPVEKEPSDDPKKAEKDKKKPEDLGLGALGEIDPNAGGWTIGTSL